MLLISIAIGAVAVGLWEFVPLQTVNRSGSAPVTIRRVSSFWGLAKLRLQPCKTHKEAVTLARKPFAPVTASGGCAIDPYEGSWIDLSVPFERRTSPCGRELSWFRWEAIALSGEDEEGKLLWGVVDLRNNLRWDGVLEIHFAALEPVEVEEGV